ncbi:MAG: NAD(P)/FAD-dependent oxidoreductase [bacterium]
MKAKYRDLVLKDGSKIAVIGAGPAGAFFADFAAHLAQEKGLNVSIALFDGKDFTQSGPGGCNMCAGVISETLVNRLKARGIVLPEERVQRKIEGYYLRVKAGGFLLKHPLGKRQITTVFRGNGPRFSEQGKNISFDDYLLEHVRRKGLKVISTPVKRVELPPNPEEPVRVIYGSEEESTFEADLAVGAFGLNTNMMDEMRKLNFGYRPPRTLNTWSAEIPLNDDFIRKNFGNNIFAYNWSTAKGLRFAGIIPKKDYITVNVIGKRDVEKENLVEFLNLPVVREKFPRDWRWSYKVCYCSPKIATTSAKKPFTHRLVIIGDASSCRYYKNGIESAFITAQLAAETAFNLGISESAFLKGYFRRVKKIIIKDNFYGRILFKINNLVSGSAFLSGVLLKVATDEEGHGRTKRMRDILWNMYTGNIPYKTIFLRFFSPILQWRLMTAILKLSFVKIFQIVKNITDRSFIGLRGEER